ncbi:sigma 54-interacting transcriptional regulator [Desulfocicer niacini]
MKVDVRIITATNRDLEDLIEKKNFARICFSGSTSFPYICPHCGGENRISPF